jgi:hypothetical protein
MVALQSAEIDEYRVTAIREDLGVDIAPFAD